MKRTITSIFAIMLALAMVMSLAACGGASNSSSSDNPETIVKKSAENRITVEVALNYKINGAPSCSSIVTKIDDNLYEVTGKVTVRDEYGDSYTGKYTVKVEYDPDKNEAKVKSSDLEKPTKN